MRLRALTVVGTAVAALVVWLVATAVAGADLVVPGTGRVTALAVLVVALLVGLAGWGLLALLERFTARARTVWRIVAAVVLLVSFAGPAGADGGAAIAWLLALHLVTGVSLILGLPRAARRPVAPTVAGKP